MLLGPHLLYGSLLVVVSASIVMGIKERTMKLYGLWHRFVTQGILCGHWTKPSQELLVGSLSYNALRLEGIAVWWCKNCSKLVNLFSFVLCCCSDMRFFCHCAKFYPLGFAPLLTASEFFVKPISQWYWVLGCFFFLSFPLSPFLKICCALVCNCMNCKQVLKCYTVHCSFYAS